MFVRGTVWVLICVGLVSVGLGQAYGQVPLSGERLKKLNDELARVQADLQVAAIRSARGAVDAGIFAKGLRWALLYDRELSDADVGLMEKAVTRARERVAAIDRAPWSARTGKVALGYRSAVDGSVQPYGLIVPAGYDSQKAMRLDVVLHGSTRPVGLSELRFIARFDEGDGVNPAPPEQPYLELHPLGRVENCYRWAGETDVFEAIEDVCRRYNVDRDRIVLRGMSMGASGTWHLGLKHPDRFVALGPYCGYVDTHRFSETPLGTFVKVGPLPEHQEMGLHMLDSVDYAANAGVVPAIACMGEKDVFFDAHVIMGQAMQREGLTMVNLISPGTGHVIDPVTHAEQMKRIGEYAAKGLDHQPKELRFVTWTLKYSRCHWLQVLGLEKHYSRAEISAKLGADSIVIAEPTNITRFAISMKELPATLKSVQIGSATLPLPATSESKRLSVVLERVDGKWQLAGELNPLKLAGKRPGLQGPIDDAFTSPFLCVRGTGSAWNTGVQAYSERSLQRFAEEWRHYFRGDLSIKDDSAVTEEDVRNCNLILFGDPGSNPWIAKALPGLPIGWSKDVVKVGTQEYPAADHVPALIVANPIKGGERRYLVINSGHTFREAELAKLNYLLFPRWGDWAVLQIDPRLNAADALNEKVLRAGYFDEEWK